MNLGAFAPILAMLVLATAFAVISIVVSAFMAPHRPTRAKYSAYESGIEPGRLPRGERYPVKFYLTAMLFVVFDVEVIFLYPWAATFPNLEPGSHQSLVWLMRIMFFLLTTVVAYLYGYRKGVFRFD